MIDHKAAGVAAHGMKLPIRSLRTGPAHAKIEAVPDGRSPVRRSPSC